MSFARAGFACLVMTAAPGLVADPLYGKDLSPLASLFGFPVMRDAAALAPGRWSAELTASVANNYAVDDSPREAANFDGESLRLTSRLRLGLGRGWELEADVPWQQNDGGELDAAIENWHDFWNLPDGDRDQVARDLYDISYIGPDTAFSFTEDASGWTDASLALVRELYRTEERAISVRIGAEFSSGDEEELLGNGSEDYYLSFNFSGAQTGELPLQWHGQLGYLYAGDTDFLGSAQEQNLWFAGVGMEWLGWQRVHPKLQIDSHSAVMDSSLSQTGDVSVQLTMGLTWLLGDNWELDTSFSEDIAVETAPDFVVHLALRYRSPSP